MNRRDLVDAIAAATDLPFEDVDVILKGFTEVVTAVVAKGEIVSIGDFARFAKVKGTVVGSKEPVLPEITPLKRFNDAVLNTAGSPKRMDVQFISTGRSGKRGQVSSPVEGVTIKVKSRHRPPKRLSGDVPESQERLRQLFEALLTTLMEVREEEEDPEQVIAILDSAYFEAKTVLAPRVPARLPGSERRVWERAGARFGVEDDGFRAHANTMAAFTDLVTRSLVGDQTVATKLGVDRSRVSQRVAEQSLYTFYAGDQRCFPEWQFADGTTLPGLREVITSMSREIHPLAVDHWFRTPHADLVGDDDPVSPRVWLLSGGSPAVAAALASDL